MATLRFRTNGVLWLSPYTESALLSDLRYVVASGARSARRGRSGLMIYILRLFDRDGVETHRFEVDCATDGAAIAEADMHVGANSVEVWSGETLIQRLPVRDTRAKVVPTEPPDAPTATGIRRRKFSPKGPAGRRR